jgi:hypothetical protein
MPLISDLIIVSIINVKRTEINEVDFIVFLLIYLLVQPFKLNMHCKQHAICNTSKYYEDGELRIKCETLS